MQPDRPETTILGMAQEEYAAMRNARDVVPELREQARIMRELHGSRSVADGRLLSYEIAANEIERLRARVQELEAGNGL